MRVAIFVIRMLISGTLLAASCPAAAGDLQAASPAATHATSNDSAQGIATRPAAAKKTPKKRRVKIAGNRPRAKLSRDVVFDGTNINGKYLSSGEAVSTVEQEKQLGDLVGLRANFNDRLQADRDRLAKKTKD